MPGILSRTRRERFPPLELGGGIGAPLDMGGTLVLPWSGDGYSGNFLSCSKGVKDPLEVPEVRCDKPPDASAEMGHISPGGENLLDFLFLQKVLSTYDGDLRDLLWWPQESPVPLRVAPGPSGFLSRRCWGLRPCVESVPDPEYSSPLLTWILG